MSSINELESRYDRLFKDGKLVQVHVAKWSMACRLSKEDLDITEAVPSFIKLGNKMLIKQEVFSKFCAIEGKARKFLTDNSHAFPIAQAHFVPRKKLIKVVDTLNEFKVEYNKLTEEFLTNYDTYKEEMLTSFDAYRGKLETFYPPLEHIRSKFGFDLSIFEIALPKKLKETDLLGIKAEEAAIAELKKRYESEMENQYKKGVDMIDTFLKDTVQNVRGQVVEVFETIADKIKNREVITKTNLTSMKNIIDNFKSLDFLDDDAINTKLLEVESLLATNADFKENKKVIETLGKAVSSVLETAKDITDVSTVTGRYFRKVTIN